MATVTILGGAGSIGRRISEELTRRGTARVRLAGHDSEAARAVAHRQGAEFRVCDVRDRAALAAAIEDSAVVIDAAGPFQGRDHGAAEVCINARIHYIDIADARDYVLDVSKLDGQARAADVMVTSGASTVPAISAAMLDLLAPSFGRIADICVAATDGSKNRYGAGTLAAVMAGLGRPFRVTTLGQEQVVRGGDDPRKLDFPEPVGSRVVRLVNAPDVALFPERYGAATVRCYAGVEGRALPFLLQAVRWIRRRVVDIDLLRWSHFLHWLGGLLTPAGTPNGAVAVWVRGTAGDGRPLQRRVALVFEHEASVPPGAPAVMLTERILAGGPPRVGAFPCVALLTFEEIAGHLARRRVRTVFGDAYEWDDRGSTAPA